MHLDGVMDRVEAVATSVAAIALAIVALTITTAVILRAVGLNVPDAIDFSSFALGIAIFWGLVAAVRRDDLIKVDIVSHVLPYKAQRLLAAWSRLAAAAILILITVAALGPTRVVLASGEVTPELRLPIWPAQLLAFIGLVCAGGIAIAIALRRRPNALPRADCDD